MQKFDLEALHWRSSTDRQSTWPRVIFGLFGDIFTLNADYIAWKLLKMALEVEYMMDFYHPGLLVTDLHLRSSTDRQSTWPRVIFGKFGDIFTLNADYIAWKLLEMALEVEYMMEYQHPGLPVTNLHLRSSTDRQSTWPRVIFGPLFVNKITQKLTWILIKFSGYVQNGKRKIWLHFGSDLDHCLDLLDPWNLIISPDESRGYIGFRSVAPPPPP